MGLLHVSAVDLRLLCAAGLDLDPEISLVNVQAGEGCVRYGLVPKDGGLPAQLHFNTDLADTFKVKTNLLSPLFIRYNAEYAIFN